MQSFSDIWRDSRSRHVQARKAEFLQHCLTIAERHIPQEMRKDYRLEIVEEMDRLRGVYSWADEQAHELENHTIFGSAKTNGAAEDPYWTDGSFERDAELIRSKFVPTTR